MDVQGAEPLSMLCFVFVGCGKAGGRGEPLGDLELLGIGVGSLGVEVGGKGGDI